MNVMPSPAQITAQNAISTLTAWKMAGCPARMWPQVSAMIQDLERLGRQTACGYARPAPLAEVEIDPPATVPDVGIWQVLGYQHTQHPGDAPEVELAWVACGQCGRERAGWHHEAIAWRDALSDQLDEDASS